MSRGERADAKRGINVLVLCCSSCMCLFAGYILTPSHVGSDCGLYTATSDIEQTRFPAFYTTFTSLMTFPFEIFQPIRPLCRFAANTFLFFTRASAGMMTWVSETYLSLFYSFLLFHISFPLSRGRAAVVLEVHVALMGRSFGWICLSRFPCPRCVVRPTRKLGKSW